MTGASGETLQERTKGKDVRASNIVAATVRYVVALNTEPFCPPTIILTHFSHLIRYLHPFAGRSQCGAHIAGASRYGQNGQIGERRSSH